MSIRLRDDLTTGRLHVLTRRYRGGRRRAPHVLYQGDPDGNHLCIADHSRLSLAIAPRASKTRSCEISCLNRAVSRRFTIPVAWPPFSHWAGHRSGSGPTSFMRMLLVSSTGWSRAGGV